MGFYCPHKAIWSDHLAVLALLKASLINLRINHSKNTILKLDDFGQWRLQRQQYWTIWNLKISGKRAKISFYQRTLLFYDMYKCRHATLASQAYESTLARPNTASDILALGTRLRKPCRLCSFDSLERCVGLCYWRNWRQRHTYTHTVKTNYPTSRHGEITLCVVCLNIGQ